MWGSLSAVPRRTSAACLFAPAHPHDPPPPLTDSAGWEWSGRPDLNRGPPAPKAGALPGCATPRREVPSNYSVLSLFHLATGPAFPSGSPFVFRVTLPPNLTFLTGPCVCSFLDLPWVQHTYLSRGDSYFSMGIR